MKIYPAGNVLGILCFMALVLVLAPAGSAEAWTGRVVAVHDGDTYEAIRDDNGQRETVRLFGVDTPETQWKGRWQTQPYGRVATDFVRDLFTASPNVTVFEMGESYGRTVGSVILLPDGSILQEEIARAGLGWVDPRFCRKSIPVCRLWMELQQEAAEQRRGLWRDLDTKRPPVAPWLWRKGARGE